MYVCACTHVCVLWAIITHTPEVNFSHPTYFSETGLVTQALGPGLTDSPILADQGASPVLGAGVKVKC